MAAALSALMIGSLMAASVTAFADGHKGKGDKGGGSIPIIIGKPTIVHDPPSPPKKGKKDR
jgi:hypothetical protein